MKSTTFFALGVLYLSVVNLVYGVQAATHWRDLTALLVPVPMVWLVAGKLIWGIVFGVTAWGVWQIKAWGRKALLVGITLYQAHIWINHILFDVSDYARQVWPFEIGLSVLTLIVVWGFMFLPRIRRLYSGD